MKAFLTLAGVALAHLPAMAQSNLSFPRLYEGGSSVSIANPTPSVAEVEFSLRLLDGRLVPVPANPVRYEIEPYGHLTTSAADLFGRSSIPTPGSWLRAVSETSGLKGILFDVVPASRGAPAALPFRDQLVQVPDRGAGVRREVRVVNTSESSVSINLGVFDSTGTRVATTSAALEAGAGFEASLDDLTFGARGLLTARVTSSEPVAAQGASTDSLESVLINGSPASEGGTGIRVAPRIEFGGGFASTLLLSNPMAQPVSATITLQNADGGPVHSSQPGPSRTTVTIPSNGSVSLTGAELAGILFPPTVNGWLSVESPSVPLAASVLTTYGSRSLVYPLSPGTGSSRFRFSRPGTLASSATRLATLNTRDVDVVVAFALLDEQGRQVGGVTYVVPPRSTHTVRLEEEFSASELSRSDWIAIDASDAIQASMIIGSPAAFQVDTIETALGPGEAAPRPPVLTGVQPFLVRPGELLRVHTTSERSDLRVKFGDRLLETRLLAPGLTLRGADVPDVEAGIFEVRLVSGDGGESDPVSVWVLPPASLELREIGGRAFYEKIPVGSEGLEFESSVAVPIRDARVEVFDQVTGAVLTVASTDAGGRYRIPAPVGSGYALRVLSRSVATGVRVADNTSGGLVHSLNATLGPEPPPTLIATEAAQLAGAFNIREVIRKANRLLRDVEPGLVMPDLTLYWSPRNTRDVGDAAAGAIGGTFFDASSNIAFVLGDRQVDSDEFDDSVVLHEYAHFLAAKFSRDDSTGGPHVLGDVLDPRVAWSEGWANFFSAVVRNDVLYRDTFGPNGTSLLEYDLEANFVPGDAGGYWSEFATHSLLWDLSDGGALEADDPVQIDFETLWQAFRALAADSFVYVPTFLDRLIRLEGVNALAVEALARFRTIDYLASGDPPVSNPFPRPIPPDATVTGEVDSLSRSRANLAQSSHLYAFDFDGGALSIRLDIVGLGPGGNPHANDLDLFLLGINGQTLARSDRGLNGQSELISVLLPAGRYVVEVRSFYTRAETRRFVFNSAAYRLGLTPR